MSGTTLEIKETVTEEKADRSYSGYFRLIAFALLGFAISQLNALGSLSPFSISFVSGLPFDFCFSAFIGSAVGYFISHSWGEALKYVFALLICALFRLLVHRKFETANKDLVCAVVSFCSILCSGTAYLAFTTLTFETAVPTVAEAAVSFFATLIFMKAQEIPILSIGLKKLSAKDTLLLVVNGCIFLMCMSGFTIGSISPARIIAAMVIIFAAQYKGVAASCVAAICAGASLCIPTSLHFMFFVFVLSGLAAGIFSSLGQYTTALSFAVVACGITVLCGLDDFRLFPIAEAVIASTAYATIPSRWINKLQDRIENSGLIADEQVERQVCSNLERAAEKVGEVSAIVTKVSEKLDKVINPEINRIFAKMQQNVCYGCGKKSECWNKMFNETATDIMTIAGISRSDKGRTSLENRCIRPNALRREIDKYYDDFVNSMAMKMRVTEMRNIVSDQFSGVSKFLSEIAQQMRNNRVIDKAKSRTVKSALSDADIICDSLFYYSSASSCVTVEASFYYDISVIDRKKMKQVIELSTGRSFMREEIAVMDDRTMIIFEEKPKYKIQFGSSQIPLAKNRVCGDCIGKAYDQNGSEIALISDGMGTGSRAAIDATMTATLFEKLLSCGFSFESALKMVNSALMVKSTDESLATVDGLCINIYTGQADFYKAGAAQSFIRHGKAITPIEEASMPIGIIRNTEPAHCSVKLSRGDIVLLVSDGVIFSDNTWIYEELLAWTTNSMPDLAAHIASLAKLRGEKENADDISVVAVKLQ